MGGAKLRLPPLPTIRDIIRLYNLRAQKRLSQNFLLDLNITKKLVRAAGRLADGWVCEVGPGPGGITRSILEQGPKQVVLIEKDQRFMPGLELLNEASAGRVQMFHGDVLTFDMNNIFPEDLIRDWTDAPPNINLIGNLPFSVSTPLIIQWLRQISEKTGPWRYGRVKMTLTFQKEVGERLVAPILDRQRSRLSVMAQAYCDVSHVFTIPGKAFVPPPDVDVAVVHLVPRTQPAIDLSFSVLDKVVRHVFHYRRKMCKRGAQTLFPPDRPELTTQLFHVADIDPSSRSFMLSMEEFNRLCHAYNRICQENPGLFEYNYRSEVSAADWRKNKMPLEI